MPKRARVGSKVSSAKRYKKTYRRKPRTNLYRTIRRIALKNTETKYAESGVQNYQLYHNGGNGPNYLQIGNLLATLHGDTKNTRTGDEVFAKGLSIKLWLSNKADRPNVMYRIIVYSSVTPPIGGTSSTDVTDLIDTTGSGTNHMIGYIKTEKYKVLWTKTVSPFSGDFSLESGSANKEHSKFIQIYINLKNRRVKYQGGGSNQVSYGRDNIHCAVIPYDSFGTLTTDNIASMAGNVRFYFKDP